MSSNLLKYSVGLLLATVALPGQTAQKELSNTGIMNLPQAEIEALLPETHPAAYLMYAVRLFKENQLDAATFWYYVGSIRYRFEIATKPGLGPNGEPALFATLREGIGRPVNGYAGKDPEKWIAQINEALAWDESNPNRYTSKTDFPQEWKRVRAGLVELRERIAQDISQKREQPNSVEY